MFFSFSGISCPSSDATLAIFQHSRPVKFAVNLHLFPSCAAIFLKHAPCFSVNQPSILASRYATSSVAIQRFSRRSELLGLIAFTIVTALRFLTVSTAFLPACSKSTDATFSAADFERNVEYFYDEAK